MKRQVDRPATWVTVQVVLAVALCGLATAQTPSAVLTEVVTVGPLPVVSVVPGGTCAVSIPVHISPGYHIQANPAAGDFLIPLELALEPGSHRQVRSWSVVYPPHEEIFLQGAEEPLWTYHGDIVLRVDIRIKPDAALGDAQVQGTLHFQACNTRRCLFPARIAVNIPLQLVDGAVAQSASSSN